MREARKCRIAVSWSLLLFGSCSVLAGEKAATDVAAAAHDVRLKNAVTNLATSRTDHCATAT
jgi:hypothetical protein